VPLWTNRFNAPGSGHAGASAMALDKKDNVYVTGSVKSCPYFGCYSDYGTVAYSNSGVPLWTNRYDRDGTTDYATSIAVDNSGHIFVAGTSFFGDVEPVFGTVAYSSSGLPLWTNHYKGVGDDFAHAYAVATDDKGFVFVTGSAGEDFATVAYLDTGQPYWTNRYNGPGNGSDGAYSIALDNSYNVFVTGYSRGTDFYESYATLAYFSLGGDELWARRYHGPVNGNDFAQAVTVDKNGRVFVTGSSRGGGGWDYATLAYSSIGVPLWTNHYNGPGNSNDIALALAVDNLGHVFVTGSSRGSNGNSDYATVAYSAEGVPLWTNRYDGPGKGEDSPSKIAVDFSGNSFVTGKSWNGTNDDFATVGYSSAGAPLWTNRYDGLGSSNDVAAAIAVDKNGNVFVAGSSVGTNGIADFLTLKYSSSAQSYLHIQEINGKVVMNWAIEGFVLQAAPAVTSIFTNIPGATSPYTNAIIGAQCYFRLTAP
jgi:hypothetical protein